MRQCTFDVEKDESDKIKITSNENSTNELKLDFKAIWYTKNRSQANSVKPNQNKINTFSADLCCLDDNNYLLDRSYYKSVIFANIIDNPYYHLEFFEISLIWRLSFNFRHLNVLIYWIMLIVFIYLSRKIRFFEQANNFENKLSKIWFSKEQLKISEIDASINIDDNIKIRAI